MKLTYYGQSCFAVTIQSKVLLFDPFISPNELAGHIDVNTLAADYILLSHGHTDHFADCVSIAKRTGAKVICRWVITSEVDNFYYSGDTALTMDMQLLPRWAKLNFAVLPIGDNFTMDADDATVAAEWIECREIVGVHYDTFDFIKIDHEKARAETSAC